MCFFFRSMCACCYTLVLQYNVMYKYGFVVLWIMCMVVCGQGSHCPSLRMGGVCVCVFVLSMTGPFGWVHVVSALPYSLKYCWHCVPCSVPGGNVPVPPARRKKVMSMFPDQLDRAMQQQDQPVSAKCVHNSTCGCKYVYVYLILYIVVYILAISYNYKLSVNEYHKCT